MEARYLARGLRARPTPWLFAARQQTAIQQSFLNTLRYNSSNNSPKLPQSTEAPAAAAATPSQPPAANGRQSVASDFDDILNKLDLGSPSQSSTQATAPRANPSSVRPVKPAQPSPIGAELKLGPTLGRQVYVEPERGMDLPAAIRNLQQTCISNGVKMQSNKQKFHVRKGMVRKELRRTRWRKLFKFSFKATVKKIQRMQAQGW
ncbi:hypothetical protein N7468_005985 [Penicillium chermesinum]|uniref:Ribosomal protein S21 n=1 Tax=Penicillium chermesinum TaxID=63820 RepID=A0A9W9P017_9EURO|nr:uncharacterized protein N7468_005985 [Penicillium chermesinum]KAJ5233029.1 hypothetical protein N7468_005985 [Penicillium chermesinum]KAJ6172672.1 hypothetical protein N7470_001739 [Penicillium chermesinum]